MTCPTTAGSGDRSRDPGSSGRPSPPTGRPTASASSEPPVAVAVAAPAQSLSPPAAAAPASVASPRRPRTTNARARRAARRRSSGHRLFAFDRALGSRFVAGADEAGRGCLAGPLVAAAVLFDYESLTTRELRALSALNDSKQHDHAMREQLYPRVLAAARRVAVVTRSVRSIDERGLHVNNIEALRSALLAVALPGTLCLSDGFPLADIGLPQRAIVDGDATSAAIAAASIIAKVTRDRFMHRADVRHPGWSFASHVGYSTPEHRAAIAREGVSPLHRLSFQSAAYASLAL